MASTAPPSYYASNFTALYEYIASSAKLDDTWTDDETRAFLKSMKDTLTSEDDDLLNDLKKEMDQLHAASETIRTVFSTVKSGFQKVHDNPGVHEDFKTAVAGLIVRWDKFGTTFEEINKRAKVNATNAQVIANDFANTFIKFLEDRDKPLDKKKEEAKAYEEFIKKDADKASQIGTDLEKLVSGIKVFDQDWQTVAEAEKKKLDDDIKNFKDQIDQLQAEIDSLTIQINKQIAALVLSFVGIGICILAGFLCPAFWYGTVIFVALGAVSGGLLGQNVTDRNSKPQRLLLFPDAHGDSNIEKEEQKADFQRKLGDAEQAKKDIEALLTGVTSLDSESKKLFTAVKVFEDVWQSILSDLNSIIETLELVEETGDKDLAYMRLDSVKATYNRVSYAMGHYARKA
ncbi:hypothetical protein H0H92_015227 [Tricholoma furcatifolium]|nr:hypothetical protein H0H92_015227 [Tricholoma furcatifolium]